MQFSKTFPDQLRKQILASDVIGKKVSLKKKGGEFSGLCPFHNEKTPSFTVNDNKGFYHCFGCGAHGDIISFTMQVESLLFKESVIKLANDYGVLIPIVSQKNQLREKEQQEKDQRHFLLLETICGYFEDNLFSLNNNQGLQYFYKRGLNNKDLKKFHLGFATNSYDSLPNYLKKKGFTDLELLSCGVIGKNDNGQLYNKFRQRIIFPISNVYGQVIAFGGRVLQDGQPKYLNSSETEFFKKGKNLYNFFNAKKSIIQQKFVVLVEGYMDVISLSINGIENVVAPLGTAVTIDQLQLLFANTSDVVICLDGDVAGVAATKRIVDMALSIINSKNLIRFALLPQGFDPDNFIIKNGASALENILKNAKNLSEILFNFELSDLSLDISQQKIVPEKKAQLELRLMQKINLIKDQNSKKYFQQYYKNLLFELGKNKNFLFKKNEEKNISNISFKDLNSLDKQDIYSISIVTILANFPNLINYQDEFCVLRNLEFKNQEITDLKEWIINLFDKNGEVSFLDLKSHLQDSIFNEAIKISATQFNHQDLQKITKQLQMLLLQYFYEEVSGQFNQMQNIELFEYKTLLEKKISQLIGEFVDKNSNLI